MRLVSARVVAEACGIREPSTVLEWARKGIVPCVAHGKQRRFDVQAVKAALQAHQSPKTRRCTKCHQELPVEEFRTRPDPRCCRPVILGDCRACHLAYKQEQRKRKAASNGRTYRTRDEIAQQQAAREAARSQRAKERAAKPKQTHREMITRIVNRQRERYATDPSYQAQIKAKKIRRKRAIAGRMVEPVNREVVAARDGWRCAICGKRVTRRTWSLDHIVPLSQGGEHSYRNVALAHRTCNSARGAGRLPAQAPLLPVGSP